MDRTSSPNFISRLGGYNRIPISYLDPDPFMSMSCPCHALHVCNCESWQASVENFLYSAIIEHRLHAGTRDTRLAKDLKRRRRRTSLKLTDLNVVEVNGPHNKRAMLTADGTSLWCCDMAYCMSYVAFGGRGERVAVQLTSNIHKNQVHTRKRNTQPAHACTKTDRHANTHAQTLIPHVSVPSSLVRYVPMFAPTSHAICNACGALGS